MHCTFVTALSYFLMDGGKYRFTKTGVDARVKGKRSRAKTLSRALASMGY